MKALVISDLHFGAWTGDALLSRPFALERLAPQLEDVDELILLGDVFDLMFSSVEQAFSDAEPFFDLVRERMQGKRVVFLAGNHDHHIVVRTLRSAIEWQVATGEQGEGLARFDSEYRNFFDRYLERKLAGVETASAYPTYRFGSVLLFHGHYLDVHMEGSLPNRLLSRATWRMAGGRPETPPAIEEYEATIVPLTELFFTVAQLPRGTAAQQSFYGQFERMARLLAIAGLIRRQMRRLREALGSSIENLRAGSSDSPEEPVIAGLGPRALSASRSFSVALQESGRDVQANLDRARGSLREMSGSIPTTAPISHALSAYAEVVKGLGWDADTATFVFGHTHQPLDGEFDPASGPLRFWNTGSWVYEPKLGSLDSYRRYLEQAWPGTGVVIDSERAAPRLVEMLADQNPLHGGRPAEGLRRSSDQYTSRAAELDAKLPRG